jgi:ligand-binding SRPBCC domain-containing protein
MPVIRIETRIRAPVEKCFDLARDVDLHVASASRTHERAVAGFTHGLLDDGDVVTWEAVHFGVKQRLTVRITRFDRPRMFEDEMVRGAFASLTHTHEFHPDGNATVMVDVFEYRSPLGILGVAADKLFLERYMTHFLKERAETLKYAAESDILQARE